jgi:hypothetical protein
MGRTAVVIASVGEAIQESSGALRLLDRHVAALLATRVIDGESGGRMEQP